MSPIAKGRGGLRIQPASSSRSFAASIALGTAVALAVAFTGGCAQERDPINRVQPDYLDKSMVVPVQYAVLSRGAMPGSLTADDLRREAQWFHQVTIIDKPPTTGGSGISSYTQVERIYWEVTENMLIARQAYDRLHDGQGVAGRPPVSNNPRQSEIVAAYAVSSHFDIRRDYNATTGEEINVVVENSADRPWYRRQYMRIDWSRNLVGSFSPLAGLSGTIPAEPVTFANTPDDPNRPVFEYGPLGGQARALRYFDVTNRMILHPEQTYLAGLGNIQACLLFDRATQSCQPADVTMRVSFMRVDPQRDYQPLALDGRRMDRFGFFENRRTGYNERLGGPGQYDTRHFAERHNLWVQHHAPTPAGTLDHKVGDVACRVDAECVSQSLTAKCDGSTRTCGEIYRRCVPTSRTTDAADLQRQADAQCAAVGAGSSCDTEIAYTRDDRSGLCLLPYRQRQVRPIAYHLSESYPERIMPVTIAVAAEWNNVFSEAVREARYRECLLDPAGGGPAGCESWRDLTRADNPRVRDARAVWVACHNPVWGTNANLPGVHSAAEMAAAQASGWDTDACGAQGTVARLGDIRYSMIASVNQYDANGPWGLAGISGDPETGEVISGRGAVWQTVTDTQASFATDMVRILNREVSAERFAQGQTVLDSYDYIRASGGREERTGRNVPNQPRPVHRDVSTRTELDTLLQQTTFDHFVGVDTETLSPNDIDRLSTQIDGTHTEDALVRNLGALHRDRVALSPAGDTAQSRMERLRGTGLESALMDREMRLAGGADPSQSPSPTTTQVASPFRENSMQWRALQEQQRRLLEEHECRYEANAFSDDVITTMLARFRRNEVPADVRFGRTWNFHRNGAAACAEAASTTDGGESDCPLNYEEVERYLQQYIHYGVLLHELGHSVGERHNFSGSADAINYFDRYWQLRVTAGNADPTAPGVPADQIRPRFEHMANGLPFYSPAEEAGGVEEYGYSSVMDYKGWNEDAHGLGRYDRAFVLHGYVDMVEAFDNVADPAAALVAFEGTTGGYQGALRVAFGGTRKAPTVVSPHYTDIPRIVGLDARGLPNVGNANRYMVFLNETERRNYGAFDWAADHTNVTSAGRDGRAAAAEHVLVPYMFNTDGYANSIWNTQRYDAGADMFESMRYVSQHYQDYYFANSFSRGRATFNVSGYRSRMAGRYLDQAYYSMRGVAYLGNIYQNFYAGVAGFESLLNSPTFQAGRLGSSLIVDMFVNAILMPQASVVNPNSGRHCPVTRVDGTVVYDRVNGNVGCVDIPIGAGREYSSYYDFGSGNFWRERIVNVGSFHDKSMSLNYLTDTFIWSPDRLLIEFQDPQRFQINLYTLYPAQTLRFFGSLLSRDHDDIGVQVRPRAFEEPELIRTHLATLNLPPGLAVGQSQRNPLLRSIDPNLGFSLELQALTYLFGQLDAAFDRTARLSTRVWREGDTWAVPAGEGRSFVTFTNPFTGLTYAAVHAGAGVGEVGREVGLSRRDTVLNETGIAGRMLGYANRLATGYRSATGAARNNVEQQLRSYIDLIEQTRQFSGMYN